MTKSTRKHEPPSQMERARAARAYLGDRTPHKDQELAAFMAIFHPEVKGKRLRSICQRKEK